MVSDGNFRTVAGCVAIATAQIVYYWHRDNPVETLFDTPIYPYGRAPVIYSVPKGTPFQWELIHDSYTLNETVAEQEAVARLVYIVGTSAWLDYGSSTGGNIYDVISPLSSQFNLNSSYALRSDYTQEAWEQLLHSELAAGRPVLYAGIKDGNGHAVVIDGYDAERRLFHFNFGWGGNEDGYYTVDEATGMNGYTVDQRCVYGISPKSRNIDVELDLPETLEEGMPVTIETKITNNSTLPINGLYLFLSKNIVPQNLTDAATFAQGIIESGTGEHNLTMVVTPSTAGMKNYLVLTDENLNVLALRIVTVAESTGIATLQSPTLRLSHSNDGQLHIESTRPTTVKICRTDGIISRSFSVDRSTVVSLPHGLYIINNQKWFQ